jgi:hypothetical protein
MKQIVRLAAMAGTKSAGMPVEDVGPITESAENIGTARRLSRIELDHEYGLAALDRGSHATQYLDFEPFHVDLGTTGTTVSMNLNRPRELKQRFGYSREATLSLLWPLPAGRPETLLWNLFLWRQLACLDLLGGPCSRPGWKC